MNAGSSASSSPSSVWPNLFAANRGLRIRRLRTGASESDVESELDSGDETGYSRAERLFVSMAMEEGRGLAFGEGR